MCSLQSQAFSLGQLLVAQLPGEIVPLETSVLCLGTREDAPIWELGCLRSGLKILVSVKKPNPSLDELKQFFQSSPSWIYLAGHFSNNTLYNDASYHNEPSAIDIIFQKESVTLKLDDVSRAVLRKGSADFLLDKNVRMVLWGGCSVCEHPETIRIIRNLFNNPLILGFSDLTGKKILNAMLGGSFIEKDFFDRVEGNIHDIVAIRNAWMETAKAGYGGNSFEERFRAIDSDGQEWKIVNKVIRKNRKIN
jgi:hypothetical protein